MRQQSCRRGGLLLIVAVWLSSASSASAQQTVSGTWAGTENLNGFGKVSFTFCSDGKVTMVDAQSTVKGSWTQNGTSVSISFANCEYRGSLEGSSIRGAAYFTAGTSRVQWSFAVNKM